MKITKVEAFQVFDNPPTPVDGLFVLPTALGLGLTMNEAALARLRVEI